MRPGYPAPPPGRARPVIEDWLDPATAVDSDSFEDSYESQEPPSAHTSRHRTSRSRYQRQRSSYPPSNNHFQSHIDSYGHQYPYLGWPEGGKTEPLISFVTNEWRKKHRSRSRSSSTERRVLEEWPSILVSRICRRGTILWLMLPCFIWLLRWSFNRAHDAFEETAMLKETARLRYENQPPRTKGRGWFGENTRVELTGVNQLGTLPSTWKWGEDKRLVIVGDVHGCVDDLLALLKSLSFDLISDHLILAGDIVSRGPSSSETLTLAASLNASCVRGNHDDRILLAHRDLSSPLRVFHLSGAAPNPVSGTASQQSAELALAAALSPENVAYLRSCPLILDLGGLPSLAPHSVVVHAGLVPSLAMDRQDPRSVMTMRSIDLRTLYPSSDPSPRVLNQLKNKGRLKGTRASTSRSPLAKIAAAHKFIAPWTDLWEEYQKIAPEADRTLVVYGHDSPRGLVEGKWAIGLDSGCVDGGELSALVLSMKEGQVKRSIKSVQCRTPNAEGSSVPKGG